VIRLIVRTLIALAGNAVGLLVAAAILDDMEVVRPPVPRVEEVPRGAAQLSKRLGRTMPSDALPRVPA
jgi:hypothetical protein